MIVFFGVNQDDGEYQVYESVASKFNGATFYHTYDASAREHFNLEAHHRVGVFKNFDSKRDIYESHPLEEENLTKFLESTTVPTVIPFNDQAIQLIFQQ